MKSRNDARAAVTGAGAPLPSEWMRRNPTTSRRRRRTHIAKVPDFAAISRAALLVLPALLSLWLPGGRREGHEYVALNPHRVDRHLGSFRINLRSGRWCDFATADKGGDAVSLLAFLESCSQTEAAHRLARLLGLEAGQ